MEKGNFGERLRRERELREVSIEEVVKSTRIARRYVEALEREDWEGLPGGTFARGFVRSIAHFLGLDEETLLAEYDLVRSGEAGSAQARTEQQGIPRRIPRLVTLLLFALALAGIAAAAVYGWRRYASRGKARTSASELVPSESRRARLRFAAVLHKMNCQATRPIGAPRRRVESD